MPNNKKVGIENIWNTISFPEAALLGKRVPKKRFLESGGLVASDKKYFTENVKNVYWEYTLKPSTCPVLPYRDNQREYLEVAVLQVEIHSPENNKQSGHKRIAEIIHKAIPYPLMLGFYTESGDIALSIAPKRFSQVAHGAFVVEHSYTTGRMKCELLNTYEAAFIASLAWNSMPLQTYGTLYNAWIDRFIAYECSTLSGVFTLGKASDQKKRIAQLARCREIESTISELRGQMKKAAFNRQVELNTQIKKCERALRQLTEHL